MSGFLQRADFVSIRDESAQYMDTPENFAADYGAPLPALPQGITERFYVPGVRHALSRDGDTVGGGSKPWAFGDEVIASLTQIIAARAARQAQSEPESGPVPAIVRCSPLQARRALRAAGLIEQVNAAVASADADTQDAWEYGTVIERDNAIIGAMAVQLGLTSEDVDGLFALAVTL